MYSPCEPTERNDAIRLFTKVALVDQVRFSPVRGRGRQGRVTIADVADLAGVSTSTASLAFRAPDRVQEATRRGILDAAEALGYEGPHPVASSLRSGRTGIVGIVITDRIQRAFGNPVAQATMNGLAEVLDREGYGMLLLPGRDPRSGGPVLLRTLPVDAIVFATRGEAADALLPVGRARGVPMVGVEGPHESDVTVVDVDDRRGMAELAGFVSALGHTRIAVVMRRTTMGPEHPPGPPRPIGADLDAIANPTIRGRLEAVAEAFPHAVRVEAGGRDAAAGAAAARVLLDHPTAPTAILAQNDLLALGALQAARERGLRVPEDLTVTGFDGIELPGLDRTLTTVRQPLHERGRTAGELVTALLRGERPESVVLPVELVPGQTAGPPPAFDAR